MTNPEKASGRKLEGKCYCGAVHYVVADGFLYAANCHCSDCRRTTGSALKPFAGIRRDKLAVTTGEDKLTIFGEEDGNNTHCGICGSLLYSVVRHGGFVHVAMGTLIDDPSIRPTKHIFVRLQGVLVHHHRRPAPIREACGGDRTCRELRLRVRPEAITP